MSNRPALPPRCRSHRSAQNPTSGANGENPSTLDSSTFPPYGWMTPGTTENNFAAVAAFQATLKDSADSYFQFGGRIIYESLTTPTGCDFESTPNPWRWFPDSRGLGIANDTYSVGTSGYAYTNGIIIPTNTDDDIGVAGPGAWEWLTQVQMNRKIPLPCTVSVTQTMSINYPEINGGFGGGPVAFEAHTDTFVVGDGYFTVSRGNQAGAAKTAPIMVVGALRSIDEQQSLYRQLLQWLGM